MPMSETDKILKSILFEFKGIRKELRAINQSIQFQAIITSNMSDQAKSELLDVMKEADSQE